MSNEDRIKELEQWVEDLQSGMYINCVYCGHRYGPTESTQASGTEQLRRHILQCPKHPMAGLAKAMRHIYERGSSALSESRFSTDVRVLYGIIAKIQSDASIALSEAKLLSPGVCITEPCNYIWDGEPGETHDEYHERKYSR